MDSIETGIQGAKVQSWGKNPRGLLKRLIDRSPTASKVRLLEEFRELVKRDDECLDVMIEYWFSNNYHSLVEGAERSGKVIPKTSQIKERIIERVQEEAQMMLLDMLLPNNKKLRECTGADCTRLSGKVGKWLGQIAAKVKPTQLVGEVLTESQIRNLYKRS